MPWQAPRLGLAVIAAVAFAAGPLRAETVRIRSGDHEGFTRIVADRGGENWSLGRTEKGYELQLGTGADFDLSGAFRLIGRNRVAELSPGEGSGTLRIDLGCDCHATAFVTPADALVIDIADGAPSPGSPFEAPVTREPTAGEQPALPGTTDHPDGRHRAGSMSGGMLRGAAAYAVAATPDSRLEFLWRGIQVPSGNAGRTMPDAAPERGKGIGLVASPSATGSPVSDDPREPSPSNEPATDRALASVPPRGAPPSPGSDRGPGSAAEASEPVRSLTPHDKVDADLAGTDAAAPDLSAARRMEAQATLLHELSRAASQGLVEIEAPANRNPPLATPDAASTSRPAGEIQDTVLKPFAVHAETSVDRDSLSASRDKPTSAADGSCLSDEDFAIDSWGDDRPFAAQIAERRTGLVAEFDRPSPEQVLSLARLYLYFGFGAEARAVLRSFDVVPEEGAILTDIGFILDGTPPGERAVFSNMTDCDSAAALWALMAWSQVRPAADVDTGAVVRAFSALPPHLRRALGPGVSERFVTAGAVDAARSVRNAIARVPERPGHALDMVAAQVDLASGNAAAGESRLEALAGTNDTLSAEALILAIESRLARGGAVEPGLADSAEALAFELQDGASGPVLTSLHILARASAGEFDRAFAGWDGWPAAAPDELRATTAARLFGMLAENADERTFLLQYFRQRHLVDWPAADLMLRLDLADRLAEAGFTGEVKRLLRGEAGYTDRGRSLLARAALDEFDPVGAIDLVAGVTGPVAAKVRAEAMAMSGDHSGAAAQFRALEDDPRAGQEAWRAGNLPLVAAIGPEPVRAALEALDHAPPAAPQAETTRGTSAPGPLASGRNLLEDSRRTRDAISALLSGSAESAQARAASTGG